MDDKTRFYDSELGIDGTAPELVDFAYRYDGDYSDEALDKIGEFAASVGMPADKCMIPGLVKKARNRKEGLPYESLKLERCVYGKIIGLSETTPYGEVEIREYDGFVTVSICGTDEEGTFTAANKVGVEEFMEGDDGFLETLIGQTLFYGKQYD